MKRLFPSLAGLLLAGCAANFGGPKDIAVRTVAVRAAPAASPAVVTAALKDASAKVAFVFGPPDTAWYGAIAQSTGRTLSGPAIMPDVGMAFLAMKPVGDTVVDLRYDGGTFRLLDALYEIDKHRPLDLLALRVAEPRNARPIIASLLKYVAHDVDPTAAVALAVVVPSPEVGDSVARMLTPGFFDALDCGKMPIPASAADGLRLFYGPEARMYCRSSRAEESAVGTIVDARLVAGRRAP